MPKSSLPISLGKAAEKAKEPKQVKIAAKPKADAKVAAGKSKKDDDSDDDESDDSDDDSEGQLIPIEGSDDSVSFLYNIADAMF